MKAFIDFPKTDLPKGDIVATLRWKGDHYEGAMVNSQAPDQPKSADEWISTKKAAEMLGFEGKNSNRSVLRLADDGFLVQKRPSPRKVKILLGSVLEHDQRTKDPEFWEGKTLRQQREKPEPKPREKTVPSKPVPGRRSGKRAVQTGGSGSAKGLK